jgi:hypothetical protein
MNAYSSPGLNPGAFFGAIFIGRVSRGTRTIK